jgi:hypothetical protein
MSQSQKINKLVNPYINTNDTDTKRRLVAKIPYKANFFLIGGKDKSVRPVPLLIHSGDFLVVTEDARQSYHAVPRRIVSSEEYTKINSTNIEKSEDSDLKFTEKYLSSHRININVRPVHKFCPQ